MNAKRLSLIGLAVVLLSNASTPVLAETTAQPARSGQSNASSTTIPIPGFTSVTRALNPTGSGRRVVGRADAGTPAGAELARGGMHPNPLVGRRRDGLAGRISGAGAHHDARRGVLTRDAAAAE